MSERSYEDRLAVRMLDAIDALPVPAGPRALRARRTLARRIDLAPVVVLMLVATLATLATPAGQSVVAEASRIIQRLIGTSPWIGYYVESPDSGLTWELRFAMGKFPGSPTTAALRSYLPATPASLGGDRWSPDGELFAISEGPRIYVGDRFGRIRKVADAADYRQVIDVAWTGRRTLMATARVPAGPQSDGMGPGDIVVTVDVDRATATYRPLPPGIRVDPRPGHV